LSPRRQRALLFSALAVLAASGAACSAILGLDPPTLACPSDSGCPDATAPLPDVVTSVMDSTGGDSSPPAVDSGAPTQVPDAAADANQDEDASGVRCGPVGTTLYCTAPSAYCCLTFGDADAASPSYGCVGMNDCSGYSIACASDNDCSGTDICCFYNSAIKCEPQDDGDPGNSCANSMVCNPSLPNSEEQCNTGQSCIPNLFKENGFTLPYSGCM
jgi:hypothetical protein